MGIIFHPHAEGELKSRQNFRELVLEVVRQPQHKVQGHSGRWIYQSRFFDIIESKELLLRVVVAETEDQSMIFTVYKTSNIDKYWQEVRGG